MKFHIAFLPTFKSYLMNTNEGSALFSRIQENILDLAPQLIFSDWLEEQERLNEALLWRGIKPTKLDLYELYGFGGGFGYFFGEFYHKGCGFDFGNGDCQGLGSGEGSDVIGFNNSNNSNNGNYFNYFNHFNFIQTNKRDAWLKQHKSMIQI